MLKIAVFASGEGTNLQALLDAARAGRIRGELALVVSSSPDAGALSRARRAGVPAEVVSAKGFGNLVEHSAALAAACRARGVDLVCLAGFLHRLEAPMLSAFPGRIMNIHPALLPAFGGKGMYGMRVHEAVLLSGAKVSGCTVHFVDQELDTGPVISQHAVPVFCGDTPAALAARVRAQEHWAYPEAVRLFCEGRLEVSGRTVRVKPCQRDAAGRIRRALVSVSDKTGMSGLCLGLEELGVEIVSTSGTAKALREAGVHVRALDTITGFPEILQGRVKTLHHKIHAGILLRRGDPQQRLEAEQLGLEPIDMVVVNLYPFARTAAEAPSPFSEAALEQIDIGGVALIRAAAKNFSDVAVLVSPADYAAALKELQRGQCRLSNETRRRLALAAFSHTAGYDTMISEAFRRAAHAPEGRQRPADQDPDHIPAPGPEDAKSSAGEAANFPPRLAVSLDKACDLRYGENPHQRAALYAPAGSAGMPFEQLQGKELSTNNLLDAYGAWESVSEFDAPAAVIFKHVTPCGVATGASLLEAFDRAWACDPLCAFGGVMAVNRPLGLDIAERLANRFMEVIAAPGFEPAALDLFRKKSKLRLLVRTAPPSRCLVLRSLGDEVLAMEPDSLLLGEAARAVTKRAPTPEEDEALRFAWAAAKHVRSNAIVLAGPNQTVGIGAGQMSRVDAVHIACVKYKEFLRDNPAPPVLVMASDAFFPFRDGVDAAAEHAKVTAVIEPGGSVKDAEVIAAADEHGLAMVFTGVRHFKH